MAKKKQEVVHEADQLTAEEEAAEVEMMEEEEPVIVATEEAVGDEKLSDEVEPEEEPVETKVSIKALDAERHKRKEVEARTAVLEEQLRRLTAPKPEEPVVDEMPDPVLDIEGFKGWQQRQLDARMEPVRQMQQHMQAQGAVGSMAQYANRAETEFKAEKPDYEAALSHARAMKSRELSGYFAPEQIQAELGKVEASITLLAMQHGKNPAQIVYDYAVMTGYKPGAADEAAKIVKLATAQKNTASTAGAGGSARAEEYTVESLANMSEKELAKVPDDKLAAALGG